MARRETDPWMIVPARHEDSHVDAIAGRAGERLDFRRAGHEVRARDPDRPLRRHCLNLQRARDSEPARLALDDADECRWVHTRIQMRRPRATGEMPVGAAPLLPAGPTPHAIERLGHVARRAAFDQHRSVPPRRTASLEDTRLPLTTDADAAGHARAIIDHEQLSMIARHEAEPAT